MMKLLQKSVLTITAITALVITANAQTPVVDENFQSWSMLGYASDPGNTANSCPGGTQVSGSCESTSLTPANSTVTKYYASGNGTVTYTLTECGVAPQCPIKSGCSTSCTTITGTDIPGYVTVGKTATASLQTSAFASISTVDLIFSTTGSNRNGVLLKSTDNGTTWDTVQVLLGGSCANYGTTFTGIAVNSTNVMLKFVADQSNLNFTRIHSLKIYGAITGVAKAIWVDSGIKTIIDNGSLRLTSENYSGSVSITNLTGTTVGQKNIGQGGEVSFALTRGMYIVRFISNNNKVYTEKVVVD